MKRSVVLALLLAVGLAAWVISGNLPGSREPAPAPAAAQSERPTPAPFRVRYRTIAAEPIVRHVVLNGATEPARDVELRAEVAGRVIELPVERGGVVEEGEVVVRLDKRDRQASLDEAEAALAMRQIEHEAADRLAKRGFEAETTLRERQAALQAARANVERAQLDLGYMNIQAPFAGVLDRRPVEIGDYVDQGDPVATVLDLDPVLAVGYLPEMRASAVRVGMPAAVDLVTGETVEGRVRFVAREADMMTRTFRLEVAIDNPDLAIPAGIGATISIGLAPVDAIKVSSALLVLDDAGRVGIRAIGADGSVVFHPAEVVRSEGEAVWLAGLPAAIRLITVGQGFVSAGQKVEGVPEEEVVAGTGGSA